MKSNRHACIARVGLLWLAVFAFYPCCDGAAQPPDSQVSEAGKRFPYQRVFVPSSDLESIEKEDFRPIEIKRLEDLLDKYERFLAGSIDHAAADNQGPVELVSSFYVAKLVGADLLSERSRLGFSGELRSDSSVGLRPWSLALQASSVVGSKTDSAESLRWSFDGLGMPRVSAQANAQESSLSAKRQKVLGAQFGWSLKALAESTTNKLKYAFDVPKCANSCMVLALPPQAVVQDCSTAAVQIDNWAWIDKRLSSWTDFSQGRSREQSGSVATESLWLIELGGVSSASFSIALSNSNRTKEDGNPTDFQPYKHLIASQTIEHFVEEQLVRTTCEASVFATQNQLLRISLAPGSRVRRLTVNQQDVDWVVEDGWIQWRRSYASGTANRSDTVSLEYFSPLPDRVSHFELPRISFDRSYVMAGSNIVHCDSSWRLTHCECESAQINETSTDQRSNGVSRVEYQWYANPPAQIIGLERSKLERRSEVLTRVSNDASGTNALIRVRLGFTEQDASQASLRIEPQWEIKSIQSLDPSDGLSVESTTNSDGSPHELHLGWGRIQKNRVADIELRLHRPASRSSAINRQLEGRHILQLPGWKRTDTLIVESNSAFELRLRESLLDAMVLEEAIPEWQKSYLPKSSNHYLFRFDEPSSDSMALGGPIPKYEPNKLEASISISNPLALEWNSVPNRLKAKVTTEVGWANTNEVMAKHVLHLDLGADPEEWISVVLPTERVEWRIKNGSQWSAISPRHSPILADGGGWQFESKAMDSECTLLAIVRHELSEVRNAVFRVPDILNADTRERIARSTVMDISIQASDDGASWSIDEAGNQVLTLPNASNSKAQDLIANVVRPAPAKSWVALTSQLQVAVDELGMQKATLDLHSINSVQGPISIALPDGWEPQSVHQLTVEAMEKVPYRTEARRLTIAPEIGIEGERGFRIELMGPRLEKRFHLARFESNYEFRWPLIRPEMVCIDQHAFLWLPNGLQVEGQSTRPNMTELNASEHRYWPIWLWSKTVAESMQATGPAELGVDEPQSSAANLGLMPKWSSSHWHMALSSKTTTDHEQSPTPLSITRKDSGQVAIAVFFVLFALMTPRWLLSKYPIATLVAILLIVGIHFGPTSLVPNAYASLVGMSVGFIAMVLYALVAKAKHGDGSVSQKNSARWSAWDERSADSGSLSPPSEGAVSSAAQFGALGICLAICWLGTSQERLFASNSLEGAEANGQDPIYQVVIPMDEDGNMVGSAVYVPVEMLDELNGKSPRSQQVDRATHPTAARYGLRLGARGRGFGITDQLTMVYEFQVGEDLEPVRFPINVAQLQFPRFSVDGVELSLGAKLRSNGSEWIWNPDRPGKRIVTIVAQPILKSNEGDRNREAIVQALDIAILPLANAQIDLEIDSQSSVEIISKGRVTDPAAGKFVAMLGAVDRLQCTITTPLSKSGAFNNLTTSQPESSEVPVMNTELFMQGDLLQAKTIVDFPKGISIGQEIEIEADSQWTPIGTNWGDAEWIETRPGSTLGRRRYLLEWKNGSGNSPSGPARDRQIAVIWVPQSSSTILNVLFAECRDRRTRRGTLRYSRVDSNWNLEGVSTWIPAIGPRDRLVWPEMNISPIATSLRIPASGGFGGVLKHKLRTERSQARVTTKWTINSNRESLSSIIELRGSASSTEALYIELPSDFSVTELSNGSGPVRYLPSSNNGKLRLQLLSDRKSLEVSNVILQARRHDLTRHHPLANDSQWSELPWIVLPSSINADQSLEVTASENVGIQLELDSNVIFGRGQNSPTLHFTKSNAEPQVSPLSNSRYKIVDRNESLRGQLTVRATATNPREIEVLGMFTQSTLTRPHFVLAVPISLKDRSQSDFKMKAIPCPDPRKAWLQIQLPDASKSSDTKSLVSLVKFSPKAEDWANEDELVRSIAAIDDELPTTYEYHDETIGSQSNGAAKSADESTFQETSLPWLTNWLVSVREPNVPASASDRFVLLESEFWIAGSGDDAKSMRTLEWQLPADAELLSIAINGSAVDYVVQEGLAKCTLIQAGLCANVVVYSIHRVGGKNEPAWQVVPPKILGARQDTRPRLLVGSEWNRVVDHLSATETSMLDSRYRFTLDGQEVAVTPLERVIGSMAQLSLKMIEESLVGVSDTGQLELNSYAGQWRKYWFKKVQSILAKWSNLPDTEDQDTYGEYVNRWHAIVGQEQIELIDDRFSISPMGQLLEAPIVQPRESNASGWYSCFGYLVVLMAIQQLAKLRAWFMKRPWWCLISLGVFAWIVSGTVIPALVFGGIGLAVAADSYWIVTSRLRRTGTRGLPSL